MIGPGKTDTGSSPHVWGTAHFDKELMDKWRFIPTRVGNSHAKDQVPFPMSVHPHTCGEQ